MLQPPLGSSRLAVIALLDSLLSTGNVAAEQAIIDSGLLHHLLVVLSYMQMSVVNAYGTGILCQQFLQGADD